jgi:hypothetical protein
VIAVLFARHDSIYKTLPGCEVYDIDRDARSWQGGSPVIAHPPCRMWGRLRAFAKPREGERELCLWAVEQVRKHGGVLEHPAGSTLWDASGLPKPGQRDEFGGYTLWVSQWWFGHKADKPTWLYILGCRVEDLPPVPFRIGEPDFVINSCMRAGAKGKRPDVPKADREHTPIALAAWLVEVASKCQIVLSEVA